jgi:hypothetical protein
MCIHFSHLSAHRLNFPLEMIAARAPEHFTGDVALNSQRPSNLPCDDASQAGPGATLVQQTEALAQLRRVEYFDIVPIALPTMPARDPEDPMKKRTQLSNVGRSYCRKLQADAVALTGGPRAGHAAALLAAISLRVACKLPEFEELPMAVSGALQMPSADNAQEAFERGSLFAARSQPAHPDPTDVAALM